jgi:hypothetical protein
LRPKLLVSHRKFPVPVHREFAPKALSVEAQFSLERLAQDMQTRQQNAEPLLRSALGKARGQALRLSLVLELLWWCAEQVSTSAAVKARLADAGRWAKFEQIREAAEALVAMGWLCAPQPRQQFGPRSRLLSHQSAAAIGLCIARPILSEAVDRMSSRYSQRLRRRVRAKSDLIICILIQSYGTSQCFGKAAHGSQKIDAYRSTLGEEK